jgi:hypothetical protein
MACFNSFGLSFAEEYVPSRSAARARKLDETHCDQEHMISTRGVLLILLHWKKSKHQFKHTVRAASMLDSLVASGTDEGFDEGAPIMEPPPACFNLCDLGTDGSGKCECLRKYQAQNQVSSRMYKTAKIRARLNTIGLDALMVCPSIKGWFCIILACLTEQIDESIDEWTNADTLGVASQAVNLMGRRKRMRIDYHFREASSILARDRGLAATTAAFCRAHAVCSDSTALSMDERVCSLFHASALLTFQVVGAVWLSADGGRFGRPAEENWVSVGWESISDRGFIGPPKVLRPRLLRDRRANYRRAELILI